MDGTKCVTCSAGFFLKEGVCTVCKSIEEHCTECTNDGACTKCAAPTYPDQGTCKVCTDNCLACNTGEKCDRCSDKYVPSDDKCVLCTKAILNCEICLSATVCDTCTKPYIKKLDKCSSCSQLFSNCDQCDELGCKSCIADYELNGGNCEQGSSPAVAIVVGITGGVAVLALGGYILSKKLKKKNIGTSIVTEGDS